MNDYRFWMDWTALGTLGATLLGWLPHATAVLAFIWYCVKLYDRFKRRGSSSQSDSRFPNDRD